MAYHAGRKQAAQGAVPQQGEQMGQPQYQQAAGTVGTPAGGEDTVTQLTKLKELLDAGVLTQEEFDGQKRKILARS